MDSPATEAVPSGATIEVVDIARIMHAIPHRYPFLMIDRVVDVVRNRSADRHQERFGERVVLRRATFPTIR